MKRLFSHALLALALLVTSLPANAVIAIAQHAVVANATGVSVSTLTTPSRTTNVSGSTFLIEVVTNGTITGTPVSDSFGNTYVLKANIDAIFASVHFYIYACDGCTGGAGHTATANIASGGLAVFFQEITGAKNPSVDVTNTFNQTTSGTTQAGASVTTTLVNDLVISFFGTASNTAINDTGAWNSIIDLSNPSALSGTQTAAVSFQNEPTIGSFNDTYAFTPSDFSGGITIALKAAIIVNNGVVMSNGKAVKSGTAVLYQ